MTTINQLQTELDEGRYSSTNGLFTGSWHNLAVQRRQAKSANIKAEMGQREDELNIAIAEYKYAGPNLSQRGWRTARNGERAFIVLAALFGGGFTFAMVELPLAWQVLLLVMWVLWLAVSWALTIAICAGVQISLRVEYDNPRGQQRAVILFTVAFTVFLAALAMNIASRLIAIHPAVFGITALGLEASALLCAACLGAIAYARSHAVELVARIVGLQRQINLLRGQLQVNNQHLAQLEEGPTASLPS
jgi:hypothetical protein